MASNIQQLIAQRYGVERAAVDVNSVTASVGTSAEIIARQSAGRVALMIVNLSSNSLYVGPFSDVASTKGYALSAQGGFLNSEWRSDLVLPSLEWAAVASGSSSAIMVVEISIDEASDLQQNT